MASAPAAAHAADRWFAVPLSVPNAGPAEATPAAFVGAGGGSAYFATGAALVADDADTRIDVYRREGASLTLATGTGAANAGGQTVSRDGSTLVFTTSDALSSDDEDDEQGDVYATTDGVTRLVSKPEPGAPFSFLSIFLPSTRISADGRFVAFATNEGLAAGDFDNRFDVYVWDRDSGETKLASGATSFGSDVSLVFGGMSSDGRYVFMETRAALIGTDGDGASDVYRYDTNDGMLALVTPGTAQDFQFGGISADGTHVYYRTVESLDVDDTDGGKFDVYQYAAGTTTLISAAAGFAPAALDAGFQKASADGSEVVFSTAEKLSDNDDDGVHDDLYKRSADGSVALVSTGPAETLFDSTAIFSDITPDGRHVFFYTAQDLTADDDDSGFTDAYDRGAATTTRISVGEQNDQVLDDASFAGFSDDASRLFFVTSAAMTSEDGDGSDDAYSRHAGHTALVTGSAAAPCTLLPSTRCAPVWHGVDGSGTRVRFSADEDLSLLDGDGGATDVYESRLAVPATVAASPAPLGLERGGPATALDDGLTVSDPYDDVFSATVHLEGGELGFADRDGISGSLNPAGDTLTLRGRAGDAAYQAALRSVTYRTSEPGSRTVEFRVDNGAGPSEPARRRIEVPGPPPEPPIEEPGGVDEPPVVPVQLRIVDSGGRVAHLRRGRWFRVPGLHFGCPRVAPAGCEATAEIWRLDADLQPLRPMAFGRVALGSGERSDALLVRIGPLSARRLRRDGQLRLLADVAFRGAGAAPDTRVTRFRLERRAR